MIHLSFIWIKFALICAPVTPNTTGHDWRWLRFTVRTQWSHSIRYSLTANDGLDIAFAWFHQSERKIRKKKMNAKRIIRDIFICAFQFIISENQKKKALQRFSNANGSIESLKSHFFPCLAMCCSQHRQNVSRFRFEINISAIKWSFFNSSIHFCFVPLLRSQFDAILNGLP